MRHITDQIVRKITFTARLGVLIGAAGAATSPAAGQLCAPINQDGVANHEFSVNVNVRPTSVVPVVHANYFAHAWAIVPDVPVGPGCPDYEVKPSTQSPEWHDKSKFGRTLASSLNRLRTTRRPNIGSAIHVAPGSATLGIAGGQAGGPIDGRAVASGCDPLAYADAIATVNVNPYQQITNSSGQVQRYIISGDLTSQTRVCQQDGGRAYAFAGTWVEVHAGRELRNGRIKWRRSMRDQLISFQPRLRRHRDPIEYVVTNLATGDVHEGAFFTLYADHVKDFSPGDVNWENDVLVITAEDVDFVLDHSHSALPPQDQGHLIISTRDGEVVSASDGGMYAGLAPPIGMMINPGFPYAVPIPNEFEFDYDLGDFNGDPLEVVLMLGGSSESSDGVDLPGDNPGCPADLDGDGVVGASDLAFLLGCWGPYAPGDACEAADLTGSGSVGSSALAQILSLWGPCP